MLKKCLVLALVLFMVPALFAGITGKMSGVIKDKQTGEPLPGVNVTVEGTTLGASTDIDGYYVIVNVPVGTHELRVSYIGYKDILIYNVRVVADATSRYDFDMEPTLLEVSEVIEITAERDLIAVDNTASRRIVGAEMIQAQPVDNVATTVSLTAGYAEGSFRGGRNRGGDVKYLVDGVDVSNPIGAAHRGTAPGQGNAALATDLPEASLQEVQVITGGMGPQYDARSAVVNIVTKSGGQNFSGFARMKMAPSQFGLDDELGQVAGYMTKKKAFDDAKLAGCDPNNLKESQYASPAKSYVDPAFRRYEFSFSGPISLKNLGLGGGLTFNLNADIFNQHGFYRGQSFKRQTYTAKMVYNTASNATFTFTLLNSQDESKNYGHTWSRIVTTGDTLYGYSSGSVEPDKVLILPLISPSGERIPVTNYDMLNNITFPKGHSSLLSFSYKKTVSSKTFYELKASRFSTGQKIRAYDPVTGKPLGLSDFRTLRFANPLAFANEGDPVAQRLEAYWWIQPMVSSTQRQDDAETTFQFNGDLVSQLNEFNELRLGIEYKIHDLDFFYESFASGGNEYTSFYQNLSPKKLAAYVEDKIETEGMIINAGLRFDYFDPNAILPENFDDPLTDAAKDPTSDIYLNPRTPAEDRIKNPTSADVLYRLAPRIGIAFPITTRDVFHINYGHYYGMPPLDDLFYNYSWSLLGAFKYLGNPNLRDEKTISYEAGIEHGFTDDVKIRLTGFYKDIADMVNMKKYIDQTTGSPYWVTTNADYGSAKGFEISVETRRLYNLMALISYTYQIARGKNSDAEQSFLDDYNNKRPRTDDFYLDWDVRHTISANIDYRVPEVWMNSKWLGDWGGNIIITYNSGRPYTSANNVPPPYQPPVNDKRYPTWTNVDLKVFKNFPVWNTVRFGAFFEVLNLLNDRTLRTIIDTQQYDLGADAGDGHWNNPTVWASPRQLRLGFEVLF